MNEFRTEGVVLKATPYEDRHAVLTVFTQDNGLLNLFVQNARTCRRTSADIATLTRTALLYTARANHTLPRLKDASTLDHYQSLRLNLERLKTAGALGKTLLNSQLPDKPAPDLYGLFVRYLDQIGRTGNLDALWASFHLKFLQHEGLLPLQSHCARCNKRLGRSALFDGEALCLSHAPPDSLLLNDEELKTMLLLVTSRSLSAIVAQKVSKEVKLKVQLLLESALA